MEEMSCRMDGCQRMAMQPGMSGCGQRRNGGRPGMMPDGSAGMIGWSQSAMQNGMDGCGRMMRPGMGQTGPTQGRPGMSGAAKQSLMKQINEASFAMDEAVLFLDTHPDNFDALQYYRNAVSMRNEALDAYKRQFGPLLVDDVTGNTWDWVTEKWPWEGGY